MASALHNAATAGDQLLRDLRQAIRTGQLRPGARLRTVRQLAADYGVSASKARRVLVRLADAGLIVTRRGDGTYVAESRGEPRHNPVLTATSIRIALPGYSAAELRRADVDHGSVPVDFMRGVEAELGDGNGYELLPLRDESAVSRFLAAGDCSVLMTCQGAGERLVAGLRQQARRGVQVIIVDAFQLDADWAAELGFDGPQGIRQTTRHLIETGHEHTVYVSWTPPENDAAGWISMRRDAYLDEIARAGLEPQVLYAGTIADAAVAAGRLKDSLPAVLTRHAVTAAVCANDILAKAVIDVAAESGSRIPQDLCLTGYDDTAGAITQGLTSVNRRFRELGRLAAAIAVRAATDGVRFHGRMVVDPELVVRRSTARLS